MFLLKVVVGTPGTVTMITDMAAWAALATSYGSWRSL